MKIDLKGIHRVKAKLAGGRTAVYFYAWRGGPRIVDPETGHPLLDPTTPAFRQAFDALKRPKPNADRETVLQLVGAFRGMPEFTRLSAATRANYLRVMRQIEDRFGTMPIALLSDPRVRGDFKAWRDEMSATPRTADFAWTVLARIFSVHKDRGKLTVNPCERGGRLYRSDRAEKIWTEAHLERLLAVCSPEVYDVVILALWTGQRQGDLLKLTWFAHDGDYIRLRQGKGGRRVTIPVGPTLRGVLSEIPRGRSNHVLNSSLGSPWTSDGFKSSFGRACDLASIDDLTFHDLRGTAVTRLSIAGCTPQQIATITGHSLETVHQILDSHYLSRDIELAEEAIRRLEKHRAGTPTVKRPVKRPIRSGKATP